jgi:hypothetical protein
MAVVAEWLSFRLATTTERDTGLGRHRRTIGVVQLERAANEEWTITRHAHIELRLRHHRFRIATISPHRAQRTRWTARDDAQHVGGVRLIRLHPGPGRGVEHLRKVPHAVCIMDATAGVERDGDVSPLILVQPAAHLFTAADQVGANGAGVAPITLPRVDHTAPPRREVSRATSLTCERHTMTPGPQDVATRVATERPPFRRSERSQA